MKHEVAVLTGALDGRTTGGAKVIDWNDSSDRTWLKNHLHWAMHNARHVHLIPALSDSEAAVANGDSHVGQ